MESCYVRSKSGSIDHGSVVIDLELDVSLNRGGPLDFNLMLAGSKGPNRNGGNNSIAGEGVVQINPNFGSWNKQIQAVNDRTADVPRLGIDPNRKSGMKQLEGLINGR